MNYDPINEEIKWWGTDSVTRVQKFSENHEFSHSLARSKIYYTLKSLRCNNNSLILDVGCGTGEDASFYKTISNNIIGVDLANIALKRFNSNGFQGFQANVKKLPFKDNTFDFVVCSGLLHHLIGQGNLHEYINEFVRVTKLGGHVVVMEPNLLYPSGILMNIFNTIKPGITGLVPHERALSPLLIKKLLRNCRLKNLRVISATYVWNRLPLFISKFISRYEDNIRTKKYLICLDGGQLFMEKNIFRC